MKKNKSKKDENWGMKKQCHNFKREIKLNLNFAACWRYKVKSGHPVIREVLVRNSNNTAKNSAIHQEDVFLCLCSR